MSDNDKWKSIVTDLHKIVKCPVCLETVKIPFKACARGHGVCLDCTKKLKKCPLCQELFTSVNPVSLKNLLEALPSLCRYSDAGCNEIVEPGNDHSEFCGFRPISCPVRNCSSRKMSLNKFWDHYKTHHSEWYFCKETHEVKRWWRPNDRNCLIPIFIFNQYFWIFIEVMNEQWICYFLATPIGKLEHKYYVRVEFKRNEFVYTYTLKAQVLSSGQEATHLFEREVLNIVLEYSMKVPENELSKLKEEDGLIYFTLNFFRV